MKAALLLMILMAVAAGCTGPSSSSHPEECFGDGPLSWSYDPGVHEYDPDQPFSSVLVLQGDPDLDAFAESGRADLHWLGDAAQRLAIVDVDPSAGPLTLGLSAHGVDCQRFQAGRAYDFEARDGATVEVGKGALVRAAGFWENGTLFYTNMHEIDGQQAGKNATPWPRAGWYAFDPDVLQVYVYDEDRSELPAFWGAARDLPLDVPGAPASYGTTIPGFNEALKGLSTATSLAVRLEPEAAYTRPGYEDHPLYGDALVFLIDVVAVADLPCDPSGFLSGNDVERVCFRT